MGQVIGFLLTGSGLPTIYISGHNASLDIVRQIAERCPPVDWLSYSRVRSSFSHRFGVGLPHTVQRPGG
jgi:hypothetical protein